MTVLLVLALFAVMLIAEYLYDKRRQPALIKEAKPQNEVPLPRLNPSKKVSFLCPKSTKASKSSTMPTLVARGTS